MVADRENHRVELFAIDDSGDTFAYRTTVTPAWGKAGTQRPCNVRVLAGSPNATLNGLAVAADLGADVARVETEKKSGSSSLESAPSSIGFLLRSLFFPRGLASSSVS